MYRVFQSVSAQYEEFLVQYNARIRERIGRVYIFNECHPREYLDPIVDKIRPGVFHITSRINIKEAGGKYGNRVCLMGNLTLHTTTDLLCISSHEKVKEASRKLIDAGKETPGFILPAECEIHFGVPQQSVKALSEAARDYGVMS